MSSRLSTLPESEVVTGERLQALADVTLLPRMIARRGRGPGEWAEEVIEFETHRDLDEESIRRLSAKRSIFVYADALALFQDHVWPRLTGTGYVLITHNSDTEVGAEQLPWIEAAGAKLRHWFAQNLLAEHPMLSPLPIGVANRRWDHGDIGLLCTTAAVATTGSRPGFVHAAFDLDTHPDRQRAWEAVRNALPEVPPRPPSPRPFGDYLRQLAAHRFCICPRGNGIDTHRFWECQYLGVIPVVERSVHTECWARAGLAMVLLDDWSELSRERLESERPQPGRDPDCLRLSHYATIIGDIATPTSQAI